ncbi:hypothetical protein MRX96_044223 [Rhipicephalus microplus]
MVRANHINMHAFISDVCRHHQLHEAATEGTAGSEDSTWFGPSISASTLSSPTHVDTTNSMRQQQKALQAQKIPHGSGQLYQLARFHLRRMSTPPSSMRQQAKALQAQKIPHGSGQAYQLACFYLRRTPTHQPHEAAAESTEGSEDST